MLREIPKTRQHPGEPRRRWFSSPELDLYIWHAANGSIVSFQFCYPERRNEYALYWKEDSGFLHALIDGGESSCLSNQTPILVADGVFDKNKVLDQFLLHATELPNEIIEFVTTKIKQCPVNSI